MAPRRSSIFFRLVALGSVALLAPPAVAQHVLRNDMTGGSCEFGLGIWSPTTLTCKLTNNLIGTIELASDGLILDGDRHMVIARPGDVRGVAANGRTGVTVRNIYVDGFEVAIGLFGGSGNRVVNTSVLRGPRRPAGPACGIRVDNSDGNWILENIVIGQRAGEGICLVNAKHNTVAHNLAAASQKADIILTDSDHNTLTGNRTFTFFGIVSDGFQLRRSNDNTIEWSSTESHTGAGIALIDSHRNVIRFNRQYDNAGGAIVLVKSNDNRILCNDSIDHRLAVDIGPVSAGNIYWLNNSYGAGTAIDGALPGANAFERPLPTGGNYWQPNAPACVDANNDGFCDQPYIFPGNQDGLPHVKPVPWLVEPKLCEGLVQPPPQQQQQLPVKPDVIGTTGARARPALIAPTRPTKRRALLLPLLLRGKWVIDSPAEPAHPLGELRRPAGSPRGRLRAVRVLTAWAARCRNAQQVRRGAGGTDRTRGGRGLRCTAREGRAREEAAQQDGGEDESGHGDLLDRWFVCEEISSARIPLLSLTFCRIGPHFRGGESAHE